MPQTPKSFRTEKQQQLVADLDTQLEQIVIDSFHEPLPGVLYHYTKWEAAESIIPSGQFRATAHNCLNDRAELSSAEDIIRAVANDLRNSVDEVSRAVLNLLLEHYQQKVEAAFRAVCEVLDATTKSRVPDLKMCAIGLNAVHRIAANAEICAKQSSWASEEEWRIVTIPNPTNPPFINKPLDLPLRPNGLLLAIPEVIIGPNQARAHAEERLSALLAKVGYSLYGEGATQVAFSEVTL